MYSMQIFYIHAALLAGNLVFPGYFYIFVDASYWFGINSCALYVCTTLKRYQRVLTYAGCTVSNWIEEEFTFRQPTRTGTCTT